MSTLAPAPRFSRKTSSPAAAPVAIDSATNTGTSVLKALQLLEAFSGLKRAVGVSDLARRSGVPKSTAHRLLGTLEAGGFVERIGCTYQLSLRAFELAANVRAVRNRAITSTAFPYLCELFAQTRQVVQLGVLDGTDVLILEQMYPLTGQRTPETIGDRIPANCTALGKAILAFSTRDQIDEFLKEPLESRTPRSVTNPRHFVDHLLVSRRSGVAIDIAESQPGLSSVAAPILAEGRAVGAISITTPLTVFNERTLAATVRSMTTQITAALTAA